jgi:hypothetical protein
MLDSLRARVDWIGGLLAFCFGLPTLGYAYGRDQALFCYVGREWASGRLPYRDAFDLKPPGIYAMYALAGELFGFQLWSIRVLELLGVLALGAAVALAVRRDRPIVRGELGAAMLLASAAYYTVFDYWDSGQAEFWEGLLALSGYLAAERMRDPLRAAVVAGLLGGAAIVFKTPVAVVLPIAGCVVVARAFRQGPHAAVLAFVLHCAAAAAVVGLVLAYFALRGGWPALVELAEYTANYVKITSVEADAKESLHWFWTDVAWTWSELLLVWFALGVVLAARRRGRDVLVGQALASLLMLTAVISVAAQRKFWAYHFVVVTPFVLLAAAYGFAELARLRRAAVLPAVILTAWIGVVWTPHWGTTPNVTYPSYTRSFWAYVHGTMRRREFIAQFTGPYGYDYALEERVGDKIGELAKPGDQLHVQGFEPAIYIHARLASPSRFASDAPIALTASEKWKAEHEQALWTKRPRFFVTYIMNGSDIDAAKAHGYKPLDQLERFYWLERAP